MLTAIRRIALEFLASELAGSHQDVDKWYEKTRCDSPEKLLAWLVESPDSAERFYTLRTGDDVEVAVLEVNELKESDHSKLPFNQGTGSQSAALGPIIKRTYTNKKAGPSQKIQNTTLDSFAEIGEQGAAWSNYFSEARDCLIRPKLLYKDQTFESSVNAFSEAIQRIDETKGTVLLAFKDSSGRLPGEVPEYGQYLQNILARTKYSTSKAVAENNQACSLCGAVGEVYPNALRGAGINFANVDREGAFSGMEIDNAWKHFVLCGGCADLIYVFSFHLSDEFQTRIAGEKAMVIPSLSTDSSSRTKFIKRFRKWIKAVSEKKDATLAARENSLLSLFAEDQAIVDLTILWAEFGQRIDNVRGVVSEVLPSRLRELDARNREFGKVGHPAFPQHKLDEFRIDLSLTFLLDLFKRPGGKKTKKENESKRLFDLQREMVSAVYHGRNIETSRIKARFDNELMKTATWHLIDMFEDGHWEGLLYEGWSKRKNTAFLTFAGWVRHLAKILYYLRTIGVLPMPATETIYQPELDSLKPYFTEETAIDSEPKAFAFLLGVLYGKVMQVQAARGVNVGANALTWLKRLTLTGKDLQELYVKVREKLLSYETEGSKPVREVVEELGRLGSRVQNLEELDETNTCYFLLLGQSLATTILPSQSKSEGDK